MRFGNLLKKLFPESIKREIYHEIYAKLYNKAYCDGRKAEKEKFLKSEKYLEAINDKFILNKVG